MQLVEELLEDADEGLLDPLRSVCVERHGRALGFLSADAASGGHMRSMMGALRRRVLSDGTVSEWFDEPGDFSTSDAWCYLPAPIDWPACSRSDLAARLTELLAAAL